MDRESPHLSPVDVEELAQYRALSWLAIASLIFGLLSFLAVFAVAGWFLPVVAVLTGAGALVAINRSDSSLTGRAAAQWGLALGLVFGAWGVSAFALEQYLLFRQARQNSAYWVDLVQQGELYHAHQLQLPFYERQPPRANLERHYSKTPDAATMQMQMEPSRSPRDELEAFFQQQPLEQLIEIGREGELRYDGSLRIIQDAANQKVGQRYSLIYREDGKRQILPFTILMERMYDSAAGRYVWRVEQVVRREDEHFLR